MIAFSGVRSSCDITARKSFFARFARCASSRAAAACSSAIACARSPRCTIAAARRSTVSWIAITTTTKIATPTSRLTTLASRARMKNHPSITGTIVSASSSRRASIPVPVRDTMRPAHEAFGRALRMPTDNVKNAHAVDTAIAAVAST